MNSKSLPLPTLALILIPLVISACEFQPSITPIDWGTAPATSSFGTLSREQQVQEAIDAGEYQRAIELAIQLYEIDTSDANGVPTYDPNQSGVSITHDDGSVEIGDGFFSSPGLLASVIGHEMVHTHQLAEGRWYLEDQGVIMNEVEAYDWELTHAAENGLTQPEIEEAQELRDAYYGLLTQDYQALADQGIYTLPLPAAPIPSPSAP